MILYDNYDIMRAKHRNRERESQSRERERVSPAHQHRYGKKNTIIYELKIISEATPIFP